MDAETQLISPHTSQEAAPEVPAAGASQASAEGRDQAAPPPMQPPPKATRQVKGRRRRT